MKTSHRLTAEDREDLALVRRRMQDVAEGRDEVIPWAETEARLDARRAAEDATAPQKTGRYP